MELVIYGFIHSLQLIGYISYDILNKKSNSYEKNSPFISPISHYHTLSSGCI